jgi:hypothetical protein
VTIAGDNTRATITAVGGAEFEVNERGIFPVVITQDAGPAGGRRLNGFFKSLGKAVKNGATDVGNSLVFVATGFADTMSQDPTKVMG